MSYFQDLHDAELPSNRKVCKFSHDISSDVNSAVLKANGISDFKEKELRVLLVLNDPSCLPEVCREYKGERNEASCPKGANCSRLHVCQHFVRGQCRYYKCNRSHNLLDTKAVQIMKGRGLSEAMMQNVQLLRVHMCNEARKEPWKEERPRNDWKRRNNDHPRSKTYSNATRKDAQLEEPEENRSEMQDGVCPSLSTTYTDDVKSTTETTSEIHSAKILSIPKSAIPLPPPRKSKTSTISGLDTTEFQQTDKSKVQASAGPPSPPAKPITAPRQADTNSFQTLIRTTSVDISNPDLGTSVRPPTPVRKAPTVNPKAVTHTTTTDNNPYIPASVRRPPALFANTTSTVDGINAKRTPPTQTQSTEAQKVINQVNADMACTWQGSRYSSSNSTHTDISNPDLGTSVRRPTPVSRTSPVNPKTVTHTATTDNNNPYISASVRRPPAPFANTTSTVDGINAKRTPPMQALSTEAQKVINQVNADMACTWQGSRYSSSNSTNNGIYEFDPFKHLAPMAQTQNASQLHVRPVVTPPENRGDPNEICFYHVWKFCKHQSKCGQMHYHLPYRWQIRKGFKDWEDLPWMEDIEKAYSVPDNTSSSQRDINFEKMTCLHHSVRRLSTASSVTQPPEHLMTTEWVWYWKNEFGKWIEYGKHGGKEKATIAAADLESIYLSDKSAAVPFQAGAQRYEINFKDMMQRNLFYKTEKEVRRRPRFVSKEDVDKLKAGSRTGSVAAPPSPPVQGVPPYWDTTALPDPGYKLVDINKQSTEYKEIEKSFERTMPGHSIHKVQRIQNITLWKFYQMQMEVMKKQNKKDVLEKKLFHGTNITYVPAICHSNFDWRICGLNGTVYGRGSYFARDASYSHNYCQSNSDSKTMFLARVLVGDFVTGLSTYMRPPPKPASQTNYFDSCVDMPQDPSIYVVFEKNQIYPEYLMEYTEKKKKACRIS